ncbi:hypothetical protein [Rhizobium tubonense]|uniref:hypothetical protein n=1 Tax=Rhizobium tubonense TaxID=484088 RepID=UPI001FCEC17C|nr:hypothetical protein [Rhizobium tubonense]
MVITKLAYFVILTSGVCFVSGGLRAEDARPHVPLEKTIGAVTPTGPVPSLAVINSAGASLDKDKLTLTGVSANAIVFADRPIRAAGHVATEQFIMQWDDGKSSFAKDPPNATVSVLGGDGSKVSDAVVTLRSPKLEGNNLTFEVSILEGSLDGSGPTAVFIDDFSEESRGSPKAGGAPRAADDQSPQRTYWHAPVLHGAWYGSALPSIASEATFAGTAPVQAPPTPCVDSPYQVCY